MTCIREEEKYIMLQDRKKTFNFSVKFLIEEERLKLQGSLFHMILHLCLMLLLP